MPHTVQLKSALPLDFYASSLTHENTILELNTPNLNGLEQLRDRLAVWLGVEGRSRRWELRRRKVGHVRRWDVHKYLRHRCSAGTNRL